jgi:hypothetical protein
MSAVRIKQQKSLSQAKDTAEVVADGGEGDVSSVACASFEVAAAEVAFGLQVSKHTPTQSLSGLFTDDWLG